MDRRTAIAGIVSLASIGFASADDCVDLDADGYVAGLGCMTSLDCNDRSPDVFPSANELCDAVDNDCDGEVDEGCIRTCPDFGVIARVVIRESEVEPVIESTRRGFAISHDHNVSGFPQTIQVFDEGGAPLAPAGDYAFEGFFGELEWDGRDLHAVWSVPQASERGVFLTPLGRWGRPGVDEPVEQGVLPYFARSLEWTGFEYGATWSEDGGDAVLGRIAPDLSVVETVPIATSDIVTKLAWNGSGYGWLFEEVSSDTGHEEVFFRKIGPRGEDLGAATRITDHAGSPPGTFVAGDFHLVYMGPTLGYGAFWQDNKSGDWQAWFARILDDGTLMDPPGAVQITSIARPGHSARETGVAWTGEEFLLVWENPSAFLAAGSIAATRVSTSGVVLETHDLTSGPNEGDPEIAWNGTVFGVVFEQHNDELSGGQPDVEFLSIGCRCSTDGDSDGVLPCGGGDCDDTDADRAPSLQEICTDGKDNDCDGLKDCNDDDCSQGGNPPGEVAGLRFEDKTTLAWDADGKATDYDVARGELADLLGMENLLLAGCLASRTPNLAIVDSQTPPIGEGVYYLVRGRAKTCLAGPWGSSLRDDTLRDCP